ncbi:hypothetical protein HELRODRAFT_171241 [Helobdella robusta]|uniref:WW domain-containing protein n=1 Tax=Helobdella robusta TaxID=6412 RepID=T1F3Z5_HELRO|nr:hypothetical protein HELRODRAFT_171241 [Helobdella robusta]ESO05593.1 hypothetical protein HELRODRAFT_171241 [Helobdella robusta]
MSEETNSELLTSFSNPNYSHVSSMITGSNSQFDDDDEDNSLLLLKSDDDLDDEEDDNDNCRGSNALTALADAIHSLELLTKDQQEEQNTQQDKNLEFLPFSDRIGDKSSGFSSDSAFSSPTSDCSPLMRIRKHANVNNNSTVKEDENKDEVNVKSDDSSIDTLIAKSLSTGETSNCSAATTNFEQKLDNQEYNKDNQKLPGKNLEEEETYKDEDDSCPKIDMPTSPKTPVGDDDDRKKIVVDLLDNDDDEEESVSLLARNETLAAATTAETLETRPVDNLNVLSPGWEKCEDASGPYYWHIKTGTIQRNPPTLMDLQTSSSMEFRSKLSEPDVVANTCDKSSTTHSSSIPAKSCSSKMETNTTSTTLPIPVVSETSGQQHDGSNGMDLELPVRFAVRSLGRHFPRDRGLPFGYL